MNNLKENLQNIRSRIASACESAGRNPDEIDILAVSKRHPASLIRALRALGPASFGENYVQEALGKMEQLSDAPIEWHFIGPLQSNKTRAVAEHFDWVQSADRIKVLRRLSAQRPPDLPELNICIQVNIDREPQKAGVLPEEASALAAVIRELPRLRLRGLMAIPLAASASHDPAQSYERLHSLFDELNRAGAGMDTLSAGMSADLEAAIMHGSTMVRIGTDLLGPRPDDSEAEH